MREGSEFVQNAVHKIPKEVIRIGRGGETVCVLKIHKVLLVIKMKQVLS